MGGRARGALRSSARLNNGAGPGGAASAAQLNAAAASARSAEAAALAAQRRARAAERALEVEDSPTELREKCRLLARALRNAKHLVVYTGAGISTAADIPDYRGPHGVWTRLQRGETVGRVEVSRARPTLTHMALTALWARGTLKFVVSQNCDGLHLRAGLPRRALAELHGDMFAERCAACRRVYLRAFDTTQRTARHAHGTRRLCHACGAELTDSIVHFGERGRAAWPLNWAGALRHAAAADVVLCLGSSLKVLRRYGRLWRMQRAPAARPALYIVNLQWTPKDAVAALKINARCDAVMAQVARRLRLAVPRYSPRRDPLLSHAVPLAAPERHTTSRPLLSPPPSASSSSLEDSSEWESTSASDSDDELPLRRLAERLRAPPPPPRSGPRVLSPVSKPPHLLPPPPDLLHAFQVNMLSGDATILLRAQHAPSVGGAGGGGGGAAGGAGGVSELRRFRMVRAPRVNGHAPPPPPPRPALPPAVKTENGVKLETYIKREGEVKWESDHKWENLVKPKTEPSAAGGAGGGAEALAAAIIARAVLLCRASLYPGLHTILAQPAPPRPAPRPAPRARPAGCGWCLRVLGARRCQWYGPPPADPLEGRAWRRVRGRRYLCACCPDGAGAGGGAAGGEGGWYGKGYRKGRRRRPRR